MIKKFLSTLVAITILLGMGLATQPVYASSTSAARKQVCEGVQEGSGNNCNAGGADLTNVVKAVVNVLSIIAGIAAVIMIIIAGMRYITSNGDPQSVSGAKRALIYAIVGLIVVAMSQAIVHFVLAKAK